jgi:hypothetical protein
MTRMGRDALRAALAALVVLAGATGCQRASVCPKGWDEDRAGAEAVWCRQGDKAQYHQIHADTRRIRQTCSYAGGLPDGAFVAFHSGGQRWIEGRYTAGRLAGRWTQWNESGSKVAEAEYRDGRIVSGAPVAVAAICATVRP